MSLVLKNLPILVVLTPLMFSLIAAILPKPRYAWIIVNIASFLTVIFSILLGIEVFENNIQLSTNLNNLDKGIYLINVSEGNTILNIDKLILNK